MEENAVVYNLKRVRKRLRHLDENLMNLEVCTANSDKIREDEIRRLTFEVDENRKDIDSLRNLIVSNHEELVKLIVESQQQTDEALEVALTTRNEFEFIKSTLSSIKSTIDWIRNVNNIAPRAGVSGVAYNIGINDYQ